VTGGAQCACGECESILRTEYLPSRLDCAPPLPNASAPPPAAAAASGNATECAYNVLDLRFTVWLNGAEAVARAEKSEAGGENEYTGGCRACLAAQPNCTVENLRERDALAPTKVDVAFAAAGVTLEIYSFYKFVTGRLTDYGKVTVMMCAAKMMTRVFSLALSGMLDCQGCFLALLYILASLSPFASIGFTVAKLFPSEAHYACTTVYCNKLVHNAVMTLASAPFDALEVILVTSVEIAEIKKLVRRRGSRLWWGKRCFLRFLRPLVKATKSGNLVCSMAWIVYDLVQARASGRARIGACVLAHSPPTLSYSCARVCECSSVCARAHDCARVRAFVRARACAPSFPLSVIYIERE
jgi:hypothetical protein